MISNHHIFLEWGGGGVTLTGALPTYHFFSTILSHFVPVCAAMSFFKSPTVSSELEVLVKGNCGVVEILMQGTNTQYILIR